MLKKMRQALLRLHRDEGGIDMVEYILLICIVALPLLAVVIWFWRDISKWANDLWLDIKGDRPPDPVTDPNTL